MLLFGYLLCCVLAYSTNCFLLPHDADSPLVGRNRQGNSVIIQMPGCKTLSHCVHKLRAVHNHQRPAVALMGPGLHREMVLQLLPEDVVSYSHVESLIELYTVTNGIQYPDDQYELQQLWLFPNYFLLSIEEATDLYTNFPREELTLETTNIHSVNENGTEFGRNSFPIMASGMGGYIFLNMSDGSIFEYSPFEGDHMKDEFISEHSILDLFRGINIGFETGEFLIEKEVATSHNIPDEPDIVEQLDEIRFQKSEITLNEVASPQIREKRSRFSDIHDTSVNMEGLETVTKEPQRQSKLFNKHGTPLLHFRCDHMEMACDNIRNSIDIHSKPRGLCKITDRKQAFINSRSACGSSKRRRGWDCNIYPFVSTRQAGQDGGVSTKLVPSTQNSVEGVQLNNFFRRARIAGHRRNRCFRLVHP